MPKVKVCDAEGCEFLIVKPAHALFRSRIFTDTANTSGLFAVNMETSELTIIRGKMAEDARKKMSPTQATPRPASSPLDRFVLTCNNRSVISGPMSGWSKDVVDAIKSRIKRGRAAKEKMQLNINGKMHDPYSRAIWLILSGVK